MECDQRSQINVTEVVGVDNNDLICVIGQIRIGGNCAR
jgi:hypothetical protein